MPPLVLGETRGIVRVLTFNRPDRLNAWTDALEDEYFDQLEAAEDDPAVRAVVVTGAGRGFCSGADLDSLAGAGEVTAADLVRPRPRDLPMTLRKPIIGAVNGVAAGLGFVEALYCDVRFGGPATRFTTAFAKRGLIAEYGIAWLLPRLVGHSRAADLLLSSRMVEATEAHRIGLIDHFVEGGDVLAAAVDYANDLAAHCSPQAMATIKSQLTRDAQRTYPDAVAEAETLMHESFRGADLVEGIASHIERRTPNFPSLPVRSTHVPV